MLSIDKIYWYIFVCLECTWAWPKTMSTREIMLQYHHQNNWYHSKEDLVFHIPLKCSLEVPILPSKIVYNRNFICSTSIWSIWPSSFIDIFNLDCKDSKRSIQIHVKILLVCWIWQMCDTLIKRNMCQINKQFHTWWPSFR